MPGETSAGCLIQVDSPSAPRPFLIPEQIFLIPRADVFPQPWENVIYGRLPTSRSTYFCCEPVAPPIPCNGFASRARRIARRSTDASMVIFIAEETGNASSEQSRLVEGRPRRF